MPTTGAGMVRSGPSPAAAPAPRRVIGDDGEVARPPAIASSADELVAGATSRTIVQPGDARSGSTFEVVELDGERQAIHFQEWWLKWRASIPAIEFVQVGIDDAQAAPGVLEAIDAADVVLVAPSNPVVSVGPILAVPGIHDTQCGFKLFSRAAACDIFPLLTVDQWAFDVEALLVARKMGYRIAEVPVTWVNEENSKVNVARDFVRTLLDLGRIRLHWSLRSRAERWESDVARCSVRCQLSKRHFEVAQYCSR